MNRGGYFRTKSRKQLSNVVNHINRVGPRLPLNCKHHAQMPVVPIRDLVRLRAVDNLGDLIEAHWRTVAVSNNKWAITCCVEELALSLDRERLVSAVQYSCRQVDVGVLDRLRSIIDSDLACGERVWIKLNPHGVLLFSINLHLRHSADHGDALGDQRVRIV